MRRALLAAIPLLLAGCAAGDPGGDAPAQPAGPQGAPAGAQRDRYQTTGMVLQSRDHGPELCLGIVRDSFPPQCDGLPITNWHWSQAEGKETAAGTTWGTYQLVGTYDGASFTVIWAGPPPLVRQPSREEEFKDEPKPACPEPEGGWKLPDPARSSEDSMERMIQAARAEPDFAGVWLSYLEPMGNNVAEDPGEFVLNVAFTGDLARYEAELRPRWGGRLCVTRQQRSYRELQRIQYDLQGAGGKRLGLRVLLTGIDEYDNAVTLTALVLDERAREALAARYGPGAVQATAKLTPAPDRWWPGPAAPTPRPS